MEFAQPKIELPKTGAIETKLISTISNTAKPEITQSTAASTTADAALFAIPICFLLIWAVIISTVLDFPKIADRKPFLKPFKSFPCRNCQFFSSNPYLKCAIHPSTAMTEQSIDCSDYCPNNSHKGSF